MAFGEQLMQARLARGWTREYIAERTHMMVRTLEYLETETIKKIPAPIYGRGFIKQYCALLEIDPQPLIDDYTALCNGQRAPITPVTRPVVREIPVKPLDPIRTGARRTLPPTEEEQAQVEQQTKEHKLVDSAESSFTSVPMPEDRTNDLPESQLPPAEDDLFRTIEAPTPPPPPPPPPPVPQKPRREVEPPRYATPFAATPTSPDIDAPASVSIFTPQRPVEDPPNPGIESIKSIGKGIVSLVEKVNKPTVQHIPDDAPANIVTTRQLMKAGLIFAGLILLTLFVFAFRYVFSKSAAAAPTMDMQSDANAFKPTPVATPPEAYFR